MTYSNFEQQSEGKNLSERMALFNSMFPPIPDRKPVMRVFKRPPVELNVIVDPDPRKVLAATNKVRVRVIETGEEFESIAEAARFFDMNCSTIRNNLRGKSKKTKNGTWEVIK